VNPRLVLDRRDFPGAVRCNHLQRFTWICNELRCSTTTQRIAARLTAHGEAVHAICPDGPLSGGYKSIVNERHRTRLKALRQCACKGARKVIEVGSKHKRRYRVASRS
jgi:hypothetical protein